MFFPLARRFFTFLLRARRSARLSLGVLGICGSASVGGLGVAVLGVCVSLPLEVTLGVCTFVPFCALTAWAFLPLVRKSRALLPL